MAKFVVLVCVSFLAFSYVSVKTRKNFEILTSKYQIKFQSNLGIFTRIIS